MPESPSTRSLTQPQQKLLQPQSPARHPPPHRSHPSATSSCCPFSSLSLSSSSSSQPSSELFADEASPAVPPALTNQGPTRVATLVAAVIAEVTSAEVTAAAPEEEAQVVTGKKFKGRASC